ncbi:hypothetical protein BpHYR1_048928 [Brachionus plicatilis]|uniref:Uncharacterized protein n=1 Tax=Brachionus plicatilis TaxID=10195 RepID=A0A3M7SGG9_BRAPC|nr:hypothetical protein BpHYR1_048928 [Brachionus plicatilis]
MYGPAKIGLNLSCIFSDLMNTWSLAVLLISADSSSSPFLISHDLIEFIFLPNNISYGLNFVDEWFLVLYAIRTNDSNQNRSKALFSKKLTL